jgi:hypothetical protein
MGRALQNPVRSVSACLRKCTSVVVKVRICRGITPVFSAAQKPARSVSACSRKCKSVVVHVRIAKS